MIKLKVKPKKVTFKKKRDNCSKKKIRKLLKYLQSELGASTTHGLSYIVNPEIHWIERLFWTISFLFCSAVIFNLLSAQYTRFIVRYSLNSEISATGESGKVYVKIRRMQEFGLIILSMRKEAPIVMSVEMDYFNWNVSYPAIYLCPHEKSDDFLLNSYINDTKLETGQDLGQYLETILSASLDNTNLIQVPLPEILPLLNTSDYAKLAANVYKRFDNSSLTTVGHWPVSVDVVMTEHGLCDVINSNVAGFDSPIKWSDSDVVYHKNNVELSFHDRDFFVQLMNYADSYKIFIQSPDDIILSGTPAMTFDEEGFLSFGVLISSTRSSNDLRSMSLNLRKCRFIDESNSRRYSVYTYNRCLMECRIRMIIKLCDCVPHFYKVLENERICNLEELKCVDDYKKEILTLSTTNETMSKFENFDGLPRNSRDCGCLDNCEYTSYRKDLEVFLPQEQMNKLRISVAAFPKVRISRDIIFGVYDIFLRSGGVVNLCIGASVISVMELLMTALRIPIYELVQVVLCIYTRRQKAKAWREKKNK